mmetsp:Transcript_42936/g.62917  ORF Transcript_42936/g.62917 Transcript_42936/m.62917 type:complete len:117 (-) Transcript_42936:870-1220(-)
MVSTEANVASLIIDAFEERDVAVYDILGAFLQSDIPKDKQMQLNFFDEFVDMMCEINPEYKNMLSTKMGKRYYTLGYYKQSMDVLKLHYCGTIFTQRLLKMKGSRSIRMTDVWRTK